jgi:CubicO group peptidase (beta-lactamase class C family)
MNAESPFSGVIHFSRKREILFARGYGFANKSESISNTVDTRFQIASGTKVFTAVAVCRLIEQKRCTLESTLSQYVDIDSSKLSPGITVGQLLTHTSGITSYFEEDINPSYEAIWANVPVYSMKSPRDFLPLFKEKPNKFPPGGRFDYNDAGYILLGILIEEISGTE